MHSRYKTLKRVVFSIITKHINRLEEESIQQITKLVNMESPPFFTLNDFFLLDSLTAVFDPVLGKNVAQGAVWSNFLDDAPPVQDSVLLWSGTYYLVVESYVGDDGAVTGADASFQLGLNAIPANPSFFQESLGQLGREGVPLTFDTFGSAYDTQLALFGFDGSLIAQNDNAGDGLQSQISLPEGLEPGTYTMVVAGAGATFSEGPFTSLGGETGEGIFNYALASPNLDYQLAAALVTSARCLGACVGI